MFTDDRQRICPGCGRPFKMTHGSQEYCSRKCMQHYYYVTRTIEKRNEQKITYIKKCATCGKEFKTNYKNSKYCSLRCSHPLKEKTIKRTCIRCGKEFMTALKHKLYCTKECYLAGQKELAERKKVEKICALCGEKYIGHYNSKYCSDKCKKTVNNRIAAERYKRLKANGLWKRK